MEAAENIKGGGLIVNSVSVQGLPDDDEQMSVQMPVHVARGRDSPASLQARGASRSGLLEVPWSTQRPPVLWVSVDKRTRQEDARDAASGPTVSLRRTDEQTCRRQGSEALSSRGAEKQSERS